jgi:hypothetical protein
LRQLGQKPIGLWDYTVNCPPNEQERNLRSFGKHQPIIKEYNMKRLTILSATITAVLIASTVLALDYNNFVAQGYRWVSIDGPYACPVKEDLRRMSRDASDINELHMIEQVRAYCLIQGALVKVVQEDGSGMAQIRAAMASFTV